jgi:hypothetical protein
MKKLLFIFSFLIIYNIGNSQQIKYTKSDSLNHIIDSLKTKLFLAEYKVEKVKFYTKIVDRKPSQIKFYKGWIKRAVK